MRLLDRVFAPAPARRLAALRVLVVGFTGVYVGVQAPEFVGLGSKAASRFRPVGPLAWMDAPLPAAGWWLVLAVLAVSGLAWLVGARGRASGIVFAATFAFVTTYHSCFGMIFHSENLLLFHVVVLAASRSTDAYVIGGAPDHDAVGEAYGWPIRLMSAVTVMTYFVAGVAKLKMSGLAWVGDDALLHHVAFDNVRKAELGATYSPFAGVALALPWMFPPLAVVTLLLEVGAPLALLNRRLGKAFAVAAWSFHVGIGLVMWITFVYPLSGFAYLSFFEPETLLDRVLARFRKA